MIKTMVSKGDNFDFQLIKTIFIMWEGNIFIRLSPKKNVFKLFNLKGKLVRAKALTKLDKL